MVTVIGLDRFETGANYLNDLMMALADKGGERRADAFLVVRYQNAHMSLLAEGSMPARQLPTANL
jgi:hypothetical protein